MTEGVVHVLEVVEIEVRDDLRTGAIGDPIVDALHDRLAVRHAGEGVVLGLPGERIGRQVLRPDRVEQAARGDHGECDDADLEGQRPRRRVVEAEDEQRCGQQHGTGEQHGSARRERAARDGAAQVQGANRRVQTGGAHRGGGDRVAEVAPCSEVEQLELVEHVRHVTHEQAAHPDEQETVDGEPVHRRERETAGQRDERAVQHRVEDDRATRQR